MTLPRDLRGAPLKELAAVAIVALREVDESDLSADNQSRVVKAAMITEEMARRLRGDRSARDVILELLKAAYPDEVPAEFLRHASGIQEFARRVRELRVELGYDVVATKAGYLLRQAEPNVVVAEKWRLMNEIRRRRSSALERIEALFRARVGEIVTTNDIEYVSRISSGPRRVRELRTEHGLRIESHKDNPGLHPGEYVLVDPAPIPASERSVDAAQRQRVLERDGFACVLCGRGPDRGKRIWLEVDHVVALAKGGSNADDNLRTLDNECHRVRQASGKATRAG
jgi:hypothetical protein